MIPIRRSLNERILNSTVLPVKERIKPPSCHCSSSGVYQTNVKGLNYIYIAWLQFVQKSEW